MNVGERIRQLRKSKGLTLTQLSKLIGLSTSFLSDIENGRSKPSLERLQALASTLETSVSVLMDEACQQTQQTSEGSQNGASDFPSFSRDSSFRVLWAELRDFSNWSEDDRTELLHYLRAKRIARSDKLQQ